MKKGFDFRLFPSVTWPNPAHLIRRRAMARRMSAAMAFLLSGLPPRR